MVTYGGGCHCGRVRFEVDAPASLEVHRCNCSVCTKSGTLHLIVPRGRFRLLRGEQALTRYRFGSGIAQHLFCSTCGIKSFYIPRSNPDGVSVDARCLDAPSPQSMKVLPFDGEHWEQHAATLAHLSAGPGDPGTRR